MTVEPVQPLFSSGAASFSNAEFLLAGGLPVDAGAIPAVARYTVFDARLLAQGAARADAALGQLEISLAPGSLLIEGLHRMEIASERRQRGAGRRLIQALAATAPEFRLNIYDIRPAALDFWIALGCSFRPRLGGWDASYDLPPSLRPSPPERRPRAEAMRRA